MQNKIKCFLLKKIEHSFGQLSKYLLPDIHHCWVRRVLLVLSSLLAIRRTGAKAVASSSLAAAAPSAWKPAKEKSDKSNMLNGRCSTTKRAGFRQSVELQSFNFPVVVFL